MIIHHSPFQDLHLPPSEGVSLPVFLFRPILKEEEGSSSPSTSERLNLPLALPPPAHETFNPTPSRPKATALSLRDLKSLAERWAWFLSSEPSWLSACIDGRVEEEEEEEEEEVSRPSSSAPLPRPPPPRRGRPILSLVTSNQHDYTSAVLGSHLATPSGIVSLHNPSYTPRELAQQFTLVSTNVVLCSRSCVEIVREAVRIAQGRGKEKEEEGERGEEGSFIGEVGVWCFEEEEEEEEEEEDEQRQSNLPSPFSWYKILPPALNPTQSSTLWSNHTSTINGTEDAIYCFSSGTSGKPKAVRLSHGAVIANVIQATALMYDRVCPPVFDRWFEGEEEERGWYGETCESWRGDEDEDQERVQVQDQVGNSSKDSASHSNSHFEGKDGGISKVMAKGSSTSPRQRELHIDVLPQFHCYGLLVSFVSLHTITPRYILSRFSLPLFLHLTTTQRCTFSFLVPPILLALSRSPQVEEPWVDLSSMRRVASGAASLSATLREELWIKRGIRVTDGYGMSEMSPIICLQMVRDWKIDDVARGGNVGRLTPSTKARVVDVNSGEDLEAVKVGEDDDDEEMVRWKQGELLLSGPQMMSGYVDNPSANASTFQMVIDPSTGRRERWLRSGDIVSLSARDGSIRIHDRLKDVIKVKGFQVSPAELEEIILRGASEQVAEVAVVGVPPSPGRGGEGEEQPWAFCVPNGTSKIDDMKEEDSRKILEYVKDRLTKYKHVKGVTWISQLPKSPAGKILKRELRDGYIKGSSEA